MPAFPAPMIPSRLPLLPSLLSAVLVLSLTAAENPYPPGPDSLRQDDVPHGEVIKGTYTAATHSVFPATVASSPNTDARFLRRIEIPPECQIGRRFGVFTRIRTSSPRSCLCPCLVTIVIRWRP